jgi:hypothetical protein
MGKVVGRRDRPGELIYAPIAAGTAPRAMVGFGRIPLKDSGRAGRPAEGLGAQARAGRGQANSTAT